MKVKDIQGTVSSNTEIRIVHHYHGTDYGTFTGSEMRDEDCFPESLLNREVNTIYHDADCIVASILD